MNTTRLTTAAISIVFAGSVLAVPASAHNIGIHDNCTNLNKKWAHGVGRVNANDRGGSVTNFKRSNKLYRTANNHNSTLDGDNDDIACERA